MARIPHPDPEAIPGATVEGPEPPSDTDEIQKYIEAHAAECAHCGGTGTAYPTVEVIKNHTDAPKMGSFAGESFPLKIGPNIIQPIVRQDEGHVGEVIHSAKDVAQHLVAQFGAVPGIYHVTVAYAPKEPPKKGKSK